MIPLPILITICLFLLGIPFALVKIIYDILTKRIETLEITKLDHERRIQRVEDLHGKDIEEIKKMIQELSNEVKVLNKYFHNDNNKLVDFLKQQGDVIFRIHKSMNEKEGIS